MKMLIEVLLSGETRNSCPLLLATPQFPDPASINQACPNKSLSRTEPMRLFNRFDHNRIPQNYASVSADSSAEITYAVVCHPG